MKDDLNLISRSGGFNKLDVDLLKTPDQKNINWKFWIHIDGWNKKQK